MVGTLRPGFHAPVSHVGPMVLEGPALGGPTGGGLGGPTQRRQVGGSGWEPRDKEVPAARIVCSMSVSNPPASVPRQAWSVQFNVMDVNFSHKPSGQVVPMGGRFPQPRGPGPLHLWLPTPQDPMGLSVPIAQAPRRTHPLPPPTARPDLGCRETCSETTASTGRV